MLNLQHELVTHLYVEERLAEAARERLLHEVERAWKAQREKTALTARVGRTLVSVGQRLEAAGSA